MVETGCHTPTTVGADGLPLQVMGQTTATVSLGTFQVKQEFTVVKSLTVDCILGADFLLEHNAIIDYKAGQLTLSEGKREFEVPIALSRSSGHKQQVVAVVIPATMELPARCVSQITVRTAETCHEKDWWNLENAAYPSTFWSQDHSPMLGQTKKLSFRSQILDQHLSSSTKVPE